MRHENPRGITSIISTLVEPGFVESLHTRDRFDSANSRFFTGSLQFSWIIYASARARALLPCDLLTHKVRLHACVSQVHPKGHASCRKLGAPCTRARTHVETTCLVDRIDATEEGEQVQKLVNIVLKDLIARKRRKIGIKGAAVDCSRTAIRENRVVRIEKRGESIVRLHNIYRRFLHR